MSPISPDACAEQLRTALSDIVHKIEIQSDFCISHPDYRTLVLSPETLVQFQKLPAHLQHKYLHLILLNFIYGVYYNGAWRSRLAKNAHLGDNSTLKPNWDEQVSLEVDQQFYDRLHASNYGIGYFDPGWQVCQQESDGTLAVIKSGLTVHIERQRHLQPLEQAANVGDLVSIRMPKNLVQNGFYVAVGNIGLPWLGSYHRDSPIIRVYFNVQPEGAIALMGNFTEQLNHEEIPFTFKVLYNPSAYSRSDSGVLYFAQSYYQQVRQVLQTVFVVNQPYFHREIPLFSKYLAPGIGLAEEPDNKFFPQESFGIHRCRILVNGLLDAWYKGQNTSEEKMHSIHTHFEQQGVKLYRPYLNANSEDIYIPLFSK
jgi:hypothetical protein